MSEAHASAQEAVRPFQLVRYYSVTSLIIIILFALFISARITQQAEDNALAKQKQFALLLAENLNHQVMNRFVIPVLREYGKITVGRPEQFKLLDTVVKNTIHSFKVQRVDILDLEGNIIYSTQPHYIQRTILEDEAFLDARDGGQASKVSPPREFFELGGGPPRVLRTFIPLRDERRRTAELGPPRAVFTITLDITQDYREIWNNQVVIMGILIFMMILLFAILSSIVLRGQRVMDRRTALESRLKEQLGHAQRLAALGRMVAGVAHEIRNPLGIVRSTAELMRGKAGDQGSQDLAQVLVDESSRLNGIVTEFLDFARPQEPRLGPLLVEEVLERNLQVLAPEAARAGVQIARRFASRPVKIWGDRDLLYRAFLNIFSNAIQAMEEKGGSLIVLTGQARKEGRSWTVAAVEDTGPGFNPDELGHLLDPFYTTKEQGTGLGLSIVNNIVGSHGGHLELVPRTKGGARVEIWLRTVNN